MKKRNIIILVIVLFLVVVLVAYTIYAVWDYKYGGMVFPAPASGQEYITKTPVVIQEKDGTVRISWSLSKKCNYNEIAVQEENYKDNNGSYFGGSNDQNCHEKDGIYSCEAIFPPERLNFGKKYFAQINGSFCGDDTEITGSVFSFVKK